MSQQENLTDAMTPTHRAHYERALRHIPWATQTNAKRYDQPFIPSRPPFIVRGSGCRIWDMDDREYIDFRASLGPITLGHCYREVDDAVRAELDRGFLFSMASPREAEAAEAILGTLGWADKIRFMKTGADTNACCLRLARSLTGRDHLLTVGYHGYQDWFALAWPNHGVPSTLAQYVHEIAYGDIAAAEQLFSKLGDQLAAALVVPVEWDRDPSPAFLQRLRELCDEHGSVLIYDEVLTGFRLARGGAAEYFGVVPDLAAYAKGISNGYPLSAYAGKARFMDVLDRTIITTTYAGETLSLTAAIKVMEILNREPVFDHLFQLGNRLRHGMDSIFHECGWPARTVGLAPAPYMAMEGDPAQTGKLQKAFFNWLYQHGVFAHNPWFINFSHSPGDIDETLEKMDAAARSL